MTRSPLTRLTLVAALAALSLGVANSAQAQISFGMNNGKGKSFNVSIGGNRVRNHRQVVTHSGWTPAGGGWQPAGDWQPVGDWRPVTTRPAVQPRVVKRTKMVEEVRTRVVTEMVPKTQIHPDGRTYTVMVPRQREVTYTVPVEVEVPTTVFRPVGHPRGGGVTTTTINYNHGGQQVSHRTDYPNGMGKSSIAYHSIAP
ncbi:hypothetical protein MalM25_36990 [Planctomycetes bacterium MalM25]|nr:hypothetical protein MalM25_36990 [Planctomycetes bacterium MalM25]